MFLFVDRILELVPGERAVGLTRLSTCEAFLGTGHPGFRDTDELSVPPCILGEAVGQLAAWTVMAANDFTLRPVGALIERVDILGQVRANDPVRLEVNIANHDDEAVVYGGAARIEGVDVFTFEKAYSPLLPVEEFDASGDLSQHFRLIHQPGDPPPSPLTSYDAARPIDYGCDRILAHTPGEHIVAEKRFDTGESFFADHFPWKPVVPMTVLMECLLRLARRLLDEGSGDGSDDADTLSHITVRNAKINRFIEPADSITVTVRLLERGDHTARFRVRCDLDGRRICQAKVEFSTPQR